MTTAPTHIPRGHAPRRISLVLLATLALAAISVGLLARHDSGGSGSGNTIQGSGLAATVTRQVPAFHSVELAGTNNLAVHVGGPRTVVVRADDNLLKLVTTKVRAGRLVIADGGSFTAKTPMSVEVTVPTLSAVTLSGTGNVTVDGVQAKRFTAGLPGDGALTVTGKVDRLEAALGGTGDLRLEGLAAHDVVASLAGTGRLRVQATGTLRATVSGTGTIDYSGNPAKVTRSITGTGSIMAH
jgi:hypothetical protein